MFENWFYNSNMPRRSDNKPNELGIRLASFRKAAGLTQAEVAEALKIPQTTVSFYEREAPYLPSHILIELTQLFGISVEALLGIEDEEQRKRGPKTKLERQFDAIKQMPPSKQQFISKLLGEILVANVNQ
ncbi:MAG: helix-turn-helix domain-containing protein [Candidatus Riflebacteria bacterium]|nr:helix-turn-helix domain-containing protein [Candidatus Riflebacteria bacterium]